MKAPRIYENGVGLEKFQKVSGNYYLKLVYTSDIYNIIYDTVEGNHQFEREAMFAQFSCSIQKEDMPKEVRNVMERVIAEVIL